MAVFGQNKKDLQIQQLQTEIEFLRSKLTPEQQQVQVIAAQIAALNQRKKDIEAEMSASIEEHKQEIEKRKIIIDRQNDAISAMREMIEQLNIDIEREKQKCAEMKHAEELALQATISKLNDHIEQLNKQIYQMNDVIDMQEQGIYQPTYEFANSDLYKDELIQVRNLQKDMIRNNEACTGSSNWEVNGSVQQGRKMVSDMQKLLLRAFNTECDDIIAHVTISNRIKSEQRIHSAGVSISKLGTMMKIAISSEYIELKVKELYLAIDFAFKKSVEKERIRELKALQREEAKAQKEIEAARQKLQKEQAHYQNAMQVLLTQLAKEPDNADLISKKDELEASIADTQKAIDDVDYREANKRAGYVYIISNIGAFGENVYKIGMTRRLTPMERIDELGDASVPFPFDVHALIFTDDAPALETALHNAFEANKVNKINHRREFFNVTLDEIKSVVKKNFDNTVEWIDIPSAEQYRQSVAYK